MLLRSIDLFGFKSFADRTRIDFSEGITAILGPNGCGKSNIVDGVRWVLGEQSIRSLRADKMEDVIFGGTEARKALSVAEVTLTLSNEHHDLPLDAPEISIRRRIYRSGENEYYLNNNPVRLRDIRELLFDTGLGKSAYSVMEQGKIDQILSTRPEERRLIFEEAAGITRFRARGQEAERKLEKTEENMRQVDGILGEVRRSYESLKRQAERTEQYRQLRERIFQAEVSIQLLRLREYSEGKHALEEKLQATQNARDALKAEIDGINSSMEESIDQVNAMEASLVENQKKLYRLDLEKNHRDSQIKILKERIGELERKIAADEERRRAVLHKLEELQGELAARKKAQEELAARDREVEGNIRSFERDIQQFASRIAGNEEAIGQMAQEMRQWEKELEELRVRLREIIDHIVAELDRKLNESGYSAQGRREAEEELRYLLGKLRLQLEGKERIFQDLSSLKLDLAEERRKLTQSIHQTLRDSLEILGRLERLFEDYRRYTPAFLEDFLAPQGIMTRKREIDGRIGERQQAILRRREQSEELQAENLALSSKIEEYRRTLEELRVSRARMQAQIGALAAETARLGREIQESEKGLQSIVGEIEETRLRGAEIGERIARVEGEKQDLEREELGLKKELARLEGDIARRNQGLVTKERDLKKRVSHLGSMQGELEKLQMKLAEVNAEIRSVHRNFSEQHARELAEFEPRMYQIEQPLKDLRAELAELREKVKALGQINLMAPEEFTEVSERYNFLVGQLEDLKKAREDLNKVTAEIRTESADLFMETFNQIRKNFHVVFRRLFGGGRAELKLVDADQVLETGVDILAQPPGKRLENISLLSGGERSLTAVALLFAIYMVKPSPFCILDEIDAALDEQNIGRFVAMLKEFASSSQFIIVTHNKKTVASAETLLGITMEESGVSKLIAIRLDRRDPERSYA